MTRNFKRDVAIVIAIFIVFDLALVGLWTIGTWLAS